mmetsp:Transcript_30192/g.83318  ORF Transcript_30192/g.83318 Transcript_30192/m.83318 type:complete len:359 (+) Transcript_30192:313-1389(+)
MALCPLQHAVTSRDQKARKLLPGAGAPRQHNGPDALQGRLRQVDGGQQKPGVERVKLELALRSSQGSLVDELGETVCREEPWIAAIDADAWIREVLAHDDAAIFVARIAPNQGAREAIDVVFLVHLVGGCHRFDEVLGGRKNAAVVWRKHLGKRGVWRGLRDHCTDRHDGVQLARPVVCHRALSVRVDAGGEALWPDRPPVRARHSLRHSPIRRLPVHLQELAKHVRPCLEVVGISSGQHPRRGQACAYSHGFALDCLHPEVLAIKHLPRVNGGAEPDVADPCERVDGPLFCRRQQLLVHVGKVKQLHQHQSIDGRTIILVSPPRLVIDTAIDKVLGLSKHCTIPTLGVAPRRAVVVG